jgi:rubrerythrin
MSELNTVNDVLKVAIKKEEDAVDFYTKAVDIVKEASTREMLQEFASEEEKHVALLQNAQSSSTIERIGNRNLPPAMNLSKYLVGEKITESSTPQDVMIVAMKNEDNAIEFYSEHLETFKGTDLADLFQRLCAMEKDHKERLESEYENIFMPDN